MTTRRRAPVLWIAAAVVHVHCGDLARYVPPDVSGDGASQLLDATVADSDARVDVVRAMPDTPTAPDSGIDVAQSMFDAAVDVTRDVGRDVTRDASRDVVSDAPTP